MPNRYLKCLCVCLEYIIYNTSVTFKCFFFFEQTRNVYAYLPCKREFVFWYEFFNNNNNIYLLFYHLFFFLIYSRLLNDNHRQQHEKYHQQQNNNNNNNSNGTTAEPFLLRRPEIGPCGWMFRILLHIILLGPVLR